MRQIYRPRTQNLQHRGARKIVLFFSNTFISPLCHAARSKKEAPSPNLPRRSSSQAMKPYTRNMPHSHVPARENKRSPLLIYQILPPFYPCPLLPPFRPPSLPPPARRHLRVSRRRPKLRRHKAVLPARDAPPDGACSAAVHGLRRSSDRSGGVWLP